MNELMDSDDLDFENLPNPEDVLGQQGEFALVGVYCLVCKAFMVVSDTVTASILTSRATGIHVKGLGAREEMYENWLGMAEEYLPEWFTEYRRIADTWAINSEKP